jgi:hypothetical protein
MSKLDPVAGKNLSFLFFRCQARLDGKDLVVAVPAPGVTCRAASGAGLRWEKKVKLSGGVSVRFQSGPRRRADRSEYPVAWRYRRSLEFRFRGGAWYGRVPTPEGWALCVQGAVRSLEGLPAGWKDRDAILVETTAHPPERAPEDDRVVRNGGGFSGPHLPYP